MILNATARRGLRITASCLKLSGPHSALLCGIAVSWQSHWFDLASVRNIAKGVYTGFQKSHNQCLYPICKGVGLWKTQFCLTLTSVFISYSCPSHPFFVFCLDLFLVFFFCIFAVCLDAVRKMKGHMKNYSSPSISTHLPPLKQARPVRSEGQDLGTHILPPHMQRPDGETRSNLQKSSHSLNTHPHLPELHRLYFLPSMTGVQRQLMFLTYLLSVGMEGENPAICALRNICAGS